MLNIIFRKKLLILISVFSFVFFSCSKEKETIGIVIVKNSDGSVVPGALVVLGQDESISPQGTPSDYQNIHKEKITDAQGRAEFVYELEAILNIGVTKIQGNDTLIGSNMLRLLKGKTVTKTVRIN